MKRMVLIAIAALLLFCGCTPSGDVAQYIERPRPEHTLPMLNGSETAYLGFSENLFRTVSETGEENPILSPISCLLQKDRYLQLNDTVPYPKRCFR